MHSIGGKRVPYSAGAWLGVFPTWEAAQAGAAIIVLGSYLGAERWRSRRRRRALETRGIGTLG